MLVPLNTTDPFHLIFAVPSAGPQVILNRDIQNQILIGPDEGAMFSSNPDNQIIDPGSAVVVDGSRDWWAIAVSGMPTVSTTFSVEQWVPPPSAIVNLQDLKNLPITIGGGGPFGSGTWSISGGAVINFFGGGGYEIILAAGTNNPFITDITITHLQGGSVVGTETYTVTNWPGTNNEQVCIRGNLIGTGLTIAGNAATSAYINSVNGSGAFTAAQINVTVLETTKWNEPSPKAFTGSADALTVPGFSGHLAHGSSLAVPASGSVIAGLVGTYIGRAFISGQGGTAAVTMEPFFRKFSVAGGTAPLYNEFIAGPVALSSFCSECAMDGLLHRLDITNQTATAGTMNEIDLTAAEYL